LLNSFEFLKICEFFFWNIKNYIDININVNTNEKRTMERPVESFARSNKSAQPILKRTRVDFMLYGAPLETTYNPDATLCVMQPLLRSRQPKALLVRFACNKSFWIKDIPWKSIVACRDKHLYIASQNIFKTITNWKANISH